MIGILRRVEIAFAPFRPQRGSQLLRLHEDIGDPQASLIVKVDCNLCRLPLLFAETVDFRQFAQAELTDVFLGGLFRSLVCRSFPGGFKQVAFRKPFFKLVGNDGLIRIRGNAAIKNSKYGFQTRSVVFLRLKNGGIQLLTHQVAIDAINQNRSGFFTTVV